MNENGSVHSLYIYGVPGQGKTSSVNQVITMLKSKSKVDFDYTYVNAFQLKNSKKIYKAFLY